MDAVILWAAITWSNKRADGSISISPERVKEYDAVIRGLQPAAHLSQEEESELREVSQYPVWARRQRGAVSSTLFP